MKKDLSINNISKIYAKILPAQIFMHIASSLSNIVNGLIIGNNLDSNAMVALGFVGPLFAIFTATASIFSGGAGILCGKYMGSGEKKKIDKVFSNTIIILVIIGILFTVACESFANPIAKLLGAKADTISATALYIRGLAIGILPTVIVPCLMIFLQMCNESNFSVISTILLAIFNFIFGIINVSVLKNGVFGVGIATSISQYSVAIIIAVFIIKKKQFSFNLKYFDKKIFIDLIIYGFPAAFANVLYSVRNIYINNIASDIGGAIAIGAIAIFGSVASLFDSINIGVLNATKMLASVYVGERDSSSLKRLMKHSAKIGLLLAFAKVIIIFASGRYIATIFGGVGEIVEMTRSLLIYYSYAMPFNILVVIIMSVYQCFGRFVYCNILYIITCLVAPLSCCLIAPKFMGIDGVWLCYLVAELVIIVIVCVVCMIKKRGLVTSLDDIIFADKGFEITDKYQKSLNNMEDVINISKEIEKYCLDKNIDKRRSMFAGLCIEEMAGNIVDHGFNKDNKKHTIDIFMGIENNEISIRIKDDCIGFDPNSKLKMMNPEDPCKNIGIRMISKIAKDMNYQTTFGLNVLTIKL